MIASRLFTIPTEGKLFTVVVSVFTMGTLAVVVLALAALVAVAYLINLVVEVLIDLSSHIASLYSHADPALQLFMLCIAGYLLLTLVRLVKPSLFKR